MFKMFSLKPMWCDGLEEWTHDEIEAMRRGICFGGGKGGKQQMQPSSQQISQTNIPEYARPYFEDILKRTQQESINPYQAYSGQRLADQTADTTQAYSNIRGMDPTAGLGHAQGYVDQMGQSAGQVGQYAQGAAGYGDRAGQYGQGVAGWGDQVGGFGQRLAAGYKDIETPQNWDSAAAQQYMSPYQQGVTDIAKREAIKDDNINRISRNTAAQKAGAFGGSRQGVVEGMAQQGLGENLTDIQTKGLQSAYTNAQQQFGQDRSARMAAQIENQRAALQGGNMMTSAGQLYGTAGQLQGTAGQLYGTAGQLQTGAGQLQGEAGRLSGALAGQSFNQQNQYNNQLQQIGAAQEARQQAGLDVGYTDFMNQRDYPRQQLNFYSGILRGMNVSPQQDTTTYQPAPNPYNQLLGTGLAAYGAYQGMR